MYAYVMLVHIPAGCSLDTPALNSIHYSCNCHTANSVIFIFKTNLALKKKSSNMF